MNAFGDSSGAVGRIITATVLIVFVALMVLSTLYSGLQTVRVQQNVTDGTTCILGSIAGRPDIERPDPELTRAACERYLSQVEE